MKKYITEIIGDKLQFLGAPRSGEGVSSPAAERTVAQAVAGPSFEADAEDDLPF